MSGAQVDPVELTRALVRIDGTSGRRQDEGFDLIDNVLSTSGYTVARHDADPSQYLLAHRPHLHASMLLFACHIDTVPTGDAEAWDHPPHSAVVDDGRLYGRGSSDMKSGLAAAVAALATAHPETSCGLLVTTDEEIGCLGAAHAIGLLSELSVGAVVIPEPTDNLIRLGHRGTLWVQLSAAGTAAHGGTPHLGHSALLDMAQAVIDINNRLPLDDAHPDLGHSTLNIGTFHAGTALNIVAAEATATLDLRYISSDQRDTILRWLDREHPSLRRALLSDLPPVYTAPEHGWVQSLPAPLSSSRAAPYFTDAAVLSTALAPGVPTVIWGPGHPEQAHTLDEHVRIDNITRAVQLYATTIASWRHNGRKVVTYDDGATQAGAKA